MKKSGMRLFLVFWVFVLAAVSYFDRTNITVAGVMMKPEFGIDQQHLGYLFTAFLLGYASCQVPAGWLAKRFGPRKVLSVGLLWWCIFTIAVTLVSPGMGAAFTVLIGLRFLLGMGEAVMYPSSNQFVAAWIPTQERARANGLIFAGTGAGAAITAPIVNWIMGSYGWRASFWFSALLGLVVGVVWWWTSRDKPQDHPRVNAAELAHIEAGLPHKDTLATPVPWARMLTNKDVWAVSIAYFAFGYVAFIFLNWFFIYLAEARGVKLNTSALYAMMPPTLMTIGSIGGGIISDKLTIARGGYTGRCIFSAVGLVLAAIFLVLGAHAADPLIATIVLAGGAGALYLSQSVYWALSADFGGPHAGVLSGFMNMLCQIAGAITASATPAIARIWGWETAFYVGAGFALVGAVAWLLVNPSGGIHAADEQVTG